MFVLSFSSDIKKALCRPENFPANEAVPMLYGIFFASSNADGVPIVKTENPDVISCLNILAKSIFPETRCETVRRIRNGGSFYTFRIKSGGALVSERFGDYSSVNPSVVSGSDLDSGAFLRGVFLIAGSVTDPNKEYHLELVVSDSSRAVMLKRFISEHGINIKQTARAHSSVLYIKESEGIEDFLTYIGAANHSLEIMRVKIVKDFRNRANRSVNCESANIDKTVKAANKSIQDIEYIFSVMGADSLSPELRETARLRVENYEMPLSELCRLFDPPISRSGLNHRLKKLSAIAETLRNNK